MFIALWAHCTVEDVKPRGEGAGLRLWCRSTAGSRFNSDLNPMPRCALDHYGGGHTSGLLRFRSRPPIKQSTIKQGVPECELLPQATGGYFGNPAQGLETAAATARLPGPTSPLPRHFRSTAAWLRWPLPYPSPQPREGGTLNPIPERGRGRLREGK